MTCQALSQIGTFMHSYALAPGKILLEPMSQSRWLTCLKSHRKELKFGFWPRSDGKSGVLSHVPCRWILSWSSVPRWWQAGRVLIPESDLYSHCLCTVVIYMSICQAPGCTLRTTTAVFLAVALHSPPDVRIAAWHCNTRMQLMADTGRPACYIGIVMIFLPYIDSFPSLLWEDRKERLCCIKASVLQYILTS